MNQLTAVFLSRPENAIVSWDTEKVIYQLRPLHYSVPIVVENVEDILLHVYHDGSKMDVEVKFAEGAPAPEAKPKVAVKPKVAIKPSVKVKPMAKVKVAVKPSPSPEPTPPRFAVAGLSANASLREIVAAVCKLAEF